MPLLLTVRVIPNASRDEVIQQGDGSLKVKLQAVAGDGKANRALCSLLAGNFACRARDVRIISGEKSRNKVVEIDKG
jgi:uncharacterized protein (TIGR00251 family)